MNRLSRVRDIHDLERIAICTRDIGIVTGETKTVWLVQRYGTPGSEATLMAEIGDPLGKFHSSVVEMPIPGMSVIERVVVLIPVDRVMQVSSGATADTGRHTSNTKQALSRN
ncbi:MAG: hypothetical protein WCF90_01150 [Methanomicrobiales archaeon]